MLPITQGQPILAVAVAELVVEQEQAALVEVELLLSVTVCHKL
jgi:hypothetical protein